MLCYKAWLETRTRLLWALLGMTALCSYTVFRGDRQALSYVKIDYYFVVLNAAHQLLTIMWAMGTTLLLMGGLLREKAVGASLFTLALPVSRRRLMAVRISVVFLEALALGIVPWIAIFLTGAVTGRTHSVRQAFFHVVLLLGGGVVLFALALLVSSLVEGEYTAPVASFGIVLILLVALNTESLRTFSPWAFMIGVEYLDRETALLMGPIPWMHAAAFLGVAMVVTGISLRVVEKRDF